MTLHTYADLLQGSDEWLEARRGIVTASVVGQLVTPKTVKPAENVHSRAIVNLLVAERITGWVEPEYVGHDQIRGSLDEPVARSLYAEHYAPVTEVGLMIRDEGSWRLGFSPDGLVGDDGLIEIKSRRPKEHLRTILADEVPIENVAQIQCGLLVSGRQWCDYVSFCGGMALWRKRVTPDPRWFDAILAAVETFEQTAAEMVARYQAAVAGLPATERGTYEMEIVI
ncbi:lambda exonuclease family protein [Jiangella asiatica]|uniref:YqaJ viral recombinase domain-containing protein n=1 Tax=Jiangella asiatica TaxID=2530372 RepID=A0A4R5CY19_9ACTN|nr:lambda exonuclease family protein [Jiangella asiatica]TDE03434.1 hypothetical protein E1269_20565 [Jiangella asiatica]